MLSAGELLTVGRIRALAQGDAEGYARLIARKPRAFRVGVDVGAELPELRAGCRRLGLRVGGRRAELLARLAAHSHWHDGRFLRLRHRRLLLRLHRWAFLRRQPDSSTLVVERLGLIRWPNYPLSPAPWLFRCRAAMLRWEALADQLDTLSADDCLRALAANDSRAPAGLDLGHRQRERALDLARQREWDGDHAGARARYLRLAPRWVPWQRVALRVARTYEAEGALDDGLHCLRAALGRDLASDLALHRSGRRLARRLRRGWAPQRPLLSAPRRSLRLVPGPVQRGRPSWIVAGSALPVEAAVVRMLAVQGRSALHTEGALWSSLFALLFAPAYFLPLPGALPVRWLSGPVDLQHPSFRQRRAATIDRVLAQVRAGEAAELIAEADAHWRGVQLSGADWSLPPQILRDVAEGIGGDGLAAVMELLLDRGWRAVAGMPDLVLLPGAAVQLDGAFPSRLPPDLLLIEVKGPGDTLRDGQAAWHHQLLRAGIAVELWQVGGRGGV